MGIASGPSWSIAAVLRLITLINILYNYRRRKLWPPPDFPTLFFVLRVFFCFSPSSKRESRFYNSGEFRRLAFLGLYRARLPLQAIACLASRRDAHRNKSRTAAGTVAFARPHERHRERHGHGAARQLVHRLCFGATASKRMEVTPSEITATTGLPHTVFRVTRVFLLPSRGLKTG